MDEERTFIQDIPEDEMENHNDSGNEEGLNINNDGAQNTDDGYSDMDSRLDGQVTTK